MESSGTANDSCALMQKGRQIAACKALAQWCAGARVSKRRQVPRQYHPLSNVYSVPSKLCDAAFQDRASWCTNAINYKLFPPFSGYLIAASCGFVCTGYYLEGQSPRQPWSPLWYLEINHPFPSTPISARANDQVSTGRPESQVPIVGSAPLATNNSKHSPVPFRLPGVPARVPPVHPGGPEPPPHQPATPDFIALPAHTRVSRRATHSLAARSHPPACINAKSQTHFTRHFPIPCFRPCACAYPSSRAYFCLPIVHLFCVFAAPLSKQPTHQYLVGKKQYSIFVQHTRHTYLPTCLSARLHS